ncbi:unnamed protein product [Sphenostylis stenocarpa]|uniref:Uncharacterized protein n=1 Tax=Sphenostylis stenocarpa TaxID=92480 RepID=A0AA86RXR7_9FABA|nr:unnamed protein product [Sphenostylis stenocarpa]
MRSTFELAREIIWCKQHLDLNIKQVSLENIAQEDLNIIMFRYGDAEEQTHVTRCRSEIDHQSRLGHTVTDAKQMLSQLEMEMSKCNCHSLIVGSFIHYVPSCASVPLPYTSMPPILEYTCFKAYVLMVPLGEVDFGLVENESDDQGVALLGW